MLKTFNRKSLLTLYISVVRPCFILAQNMSENVDADKYSVAYVTVPNIDVGKTISRGLVENKLAACVNIIPQITSIYEWEGKINEDEELLLMIKTRTTEVNKLTDYVRSNHPYTVCEVISLPIQNGNPPYLKWLGDMVPESPQTQTDTPLAQSVTSQAQTETSQAQTETSQVLTDTTQAQSDSSQEQSDTSQSQPDASEAQPDASQAQPANAQAELDTSQAQPADAQAQPDKTQAQPNSTPQAQPIIPPQAQVEPSAPDSAPEGKHCKGSTCPN